MENVARIKSVLSLWLSYEGHEAHLLKDVMLPFQPRNGTLLFVSSENPGHRVKEVTYHIDTQIMYVRLKDESISMGSFIRTKMYVDEGWRLDPSGDEPNKLEARFQNG